MKRSEMVSIIWDAINELEDADYILQVIEKAGMLPPPIFGVYDNVPTVTPTGNLDYSFKRGWEPEDKVFLNDLTYEEWRDNNGDD